MRTVVAALLLVSSTGGLSAQEPWATSYFPYLLGNPTDGLTLVARWQRTQNAPYFLERTDEKDVLNPITFSGAVSVEAGVGTFGSRFLRAETRLPGLVPGWRFHGVLAGERQGRFGYYGVGSDLEAVDGDNANTNANRMIRERVVARAEVTRNLVGPLHFALGVFLDHSRLSPRADSSLFGDRFARPVRRTSLVARPALIVDTRDREFTPSKGVLVEAGAGFGSGREESLGVPDDDGGFYTFGYLHAEGYLSPREGTVVAGRFLLRRMKDQTPLTARFTHPGWEREITLSGADGHRSFPAGAFAATRVSLASLEIRHDLLAAGDYGSLTLVAFADHARVEDPLSIRAGASKLFGGGGGIAVRVLRSAILTTYFAGGRNGFNFSMGTNWNF